MESIWKEVDHIRDGADALEDKKKLIPQQLDGKESPPKIHSREKVLFDIAQFEQKRRGNNDATMERYELYWNELMKMQEEAFYDNEQLLSYLKAKHGALLTFASAMDSMKVDGSSIKGRRGLDNFNYAPGQRAREDLVRNDRLWANRINSTSEFMDNDIIKPFKDFCNEFIDDVTDMGRRCSYIFHAVKLANSRVEMYFEQIEIASDSNNNTRVIRPKNIASGQKAVGPLQTCQAVGSEDMVTDMWLLDMCYRVAVVRHLQMKEECTRQLSRLLLRAKESETSRREAIARATERLAGIQHELWTQDPVACPVATAVSPGRASVNLSVPDMTDMLRERVMSLQQSGEVAKDVHGPHDSSGREAKDEFERLSSPLNSPLLEKSAVFLRRDGGTIVSSWTPVLLCLTHDRWLHIFDLDARCERMSESAAFHTLVSASRKGLEQSVVSQTNLADIPEFDPKATRQVLKSEAFMVPSTSICMSRSKVYFKPAVNDTTFEVVESVPNTGVGAMFKATQDRRFAFRGRSQSVMMEWVVTLEKER